MSQTSRKVVKVSCKVRRPTERDRRPFFLSDHQREGRRREKEVSEARREGKERRKEKQEVRGKVLTCLNQDLKESGRKREELAV